MSGYNVRKCGSSHGRDDDGDNRTQGHVEHQHLQRKHQPGDGRFKNAADSAGSTASAH